MAEESGETGEAEKQPGSEHGGSVIIDIYTREAADYPGVFAHGVLTMGMTGRAVTGLVGEANVHRFWVRFTSQVWPGDTLTAATRIEAIREEGGERLVDLSITTTNQDGKTVLTGTATAVHAG